MRKPYTREQASALFWARVDRSGECWAWTGPLLANGYGQCRLDGRKQYAHRVAYQIAVGPIPVGLTIDHLCHDKACVRPDHLEAVTLAENIRRAHRDGLVNYKRARADVGDQVAQNVRAELARKRYKTRHLAVALGLHPTTASAKVHGRSSFSSEQLAKAADFLGVPVAQLLDSA